MGTRLGAAVEAYNAAVGSYERQVNPQARRFNELGVTTEEPPEALEPITHLVRALAAPAAAEKPSQPAPPGELPLTHPSNVRKA